MNKTDGSATADTTTGVTSSTAKQPIERFGGNEGFPCPNAKCPHRLRSPNHTICPECAEPIPHEYVRAQLGGAAWRKAWIVRSPRTTIVIAAILCLIAIGIVIAGTLLGGGQ